MLTGKTALITGASRGIGAAIAKTFAAHGANLILCGRDSDALESVRVAILSRYHVTITCHVFDLNESERIKALFQTLHKAKITPDILVNNAGIMPISPLGMTSLESIEKTFAINSFAPLIMAQYSARAMNRVKKNGVIINLSSIIAQQGYANQSLYAMSKSAIEAMSRSLAKELGPAIRVNTIAPGFIETDLSASICEDEKARFSEKSALKRLGSAQDVANAALFLASELSSFITGETLNVNGGLTL